jgi:hypothetical protein
MLGLLLAAALGVVDPFVADPVHASPPGKLVSAARGTRVGMPTCSAGAHAAPFDFRLCCQVVVDAGCGAGYAWACYDDAGNSVPVNTKCGNGVETGALVNNGTPIRVLHNITDPTAPRILAADAAAEGIDTVIGSNAWTIMALARTSTPSGAELVEYGLFGAPAQGFTLESQGGSGIRCYVGTGVGSGGTSASGVAAANEWVIPFCTYNGTQVRNRVQDGSAGVVVIGTPAAPTNDNLMFGTGDASGNALTGQLGMFLMWNRVLSDAEQDDIARSLVGQQGVIDIVVDRNSSGWYLGSDSVYHAAGLDLSPATATGIGVWRAVTNLWTNSLDVSAWVSRGTPTITANSECGPFCEHNVGNEADTMDDNDAALDEGKTFSIADASTDAFTMSCFLKAGTQDRATLYVVAAGVNQTACVATLTGSYQRFTCSHTMPGTQATVQGFLTVGDAVGDQGTIFVSHCQFEKGRAEAGRPCVTAGASATCNQDTVTTSAARWPTRNFTVKFDVTPRSTWVGRDIDAQLFTTTTGTNGARGWVSRTNGAFWFTYGDGSSLVSCAASGALAWSVGTTYRIETRFQNGFAYAWRDGTFIGGLSGGCGRVVRTHAANATLGSSGSEVCNCDIRNLEVYSQ